MTRGAILFAFNSADCDYYSLAEFTAKRINHFLNLPVTLITDSDSLPEHPDYQFDKIVTIEPDKSNVNRWGTWINKGRYNAFNLSPYEETILLDVDYIVNSDSLSRLFKLPTDFCCHERTGFLMHPDAAQEKLNLRGMNQLWATVIYFKKTNRVRQIFECIQMIQENYTHYAILHDFIDGMYRNDYALTLAIRIVDGHSTQRSDIIPWSLIHIKRDSILLPDSKNEFNTEFIVQSDKRVGDRMKREYVTIKDFDFHVLNKITCMELIK